MEPIIDHIQITVKNMSVAIPFYDKLMPIKDPEGIKYEVVCTSGANK